MKKALIIQNKYIGDVLVASIIAKNIKSVFPDIEVHFFCYNKAISILDNNPYINKIIDFDDTELKKIPVLWKYAQYIRKEKYDIIFDPYAKLQSRFIILFSNAKRRISFNKPFFKNLYTDVFLEEKNPKIVCCTSIENRCLLLSPFFQDFSTINFQTEIFLKDSEIADARKLMYQAGITFSKPILMIGVLGSVLNKSWPLEYMSELINLLTQNFNVDILLNYIPNQKKEVENILKNVTNKKPIYSNILGKNIREFSAILKNCTALIANEGGAVNTAKAIDIPTFSIFSPHKFRKDWGCYENLFIHKSFHLMDIFPEVYLEFSIKEILKNPTPFYKLMSPDKVLPNIDKYLQEVLKISPKGKTFSKIPSLHPKITALAITYNEEANIDRYLNDISFADEIIIVDSYSTDNTKNKFLKYPNVKFIERKFDNFTNQKNFAISQASNDWIIFFDLDEHIPEGLKIEILTTVNSENTKDAYWVYRNFFFSGKHIKYSGWKNDKVIRLFKKNKVHYRENKFVHEEIICDTKAGFLKHKIDHFSFNSIDSYHKKLNQYASLKAEELFKKRKKPNFFHYYIKPAFRFFSHYFLQLGFLDGKSGYIIAKMYAQYVLDRYKYLDQLWNENRKL